MARPTKAGFPRHLHIDPYVWVIEKNGSKTADHDARLDKTLEWYDSLPNKSRTKIAFELIVAAVNGELGPLVQAAVESGDVEKAREAASQIAGAFVVDDD